MNPTFSIPLSIRWSDLDPNFHMRHSAYYDFGAQVRIVFLEQQGITTKSMQEHDFGPILFKEECLFKREIKLQDEMFITMRLLGMNESYSKFVFRHDFIKKDETLCAQLTCHGAWMNTQLRKVSSPPDFVKEIIDKMPKGEDFVWM